MTIAGRSSWLIVWVWTLVLVGLLLWPIRSSGFLLGHDMVFTPDQPVDLPSLGLSSASPRAVPLDALVAAAGSVLGGALVGRLAVTIPLVAVGVGCAHLLGSRSLTARLAAASFAIWNPYVIERLGLGQRALLWAYAALPWIFVLFRKPPGRWVWLGRALAVAAASITPTGGLFAVGSVVVSAARVAPPRARARLEIGASIAGVLLLQLPWVLPALFSSASATSDSAAVAVFPSRPEHAGGVLLTLLGGGGVWDADVVPASRSGPLAWLALAVLLAATLAGFRVARTLLGPRTFGALTVTALLGLVLAVVSSLPGGGSLMTSAVAYLPGAGLLRDAQKWIAPVVVFEAVAVGAAVHRLTQLRIGPTVRPVLLIAALSAPLLLLPDGASTLRATFTPVHYPSDWARVAAQTHGVGVAAVLPEGSYRTFSWAPGRSVIDPAPRLLPTRTVVDDRLTVSGRTLAGEDPVAAAVLGVLDRGGDIAAGLAALGVTWVVVEHRTPGPLVDLRSLVPVYQGTDVSLYRVPGEVAARSQSRAAPVIVLGGDVAVLILLATLSGLAADDLRRRRS